MIRRSVKEKLHPRNRFRPDYDFERLIACTPRLAAFVAPNAYGTCSIDYANPTAVKALNQALLESAYGLTGWDVPPGYLCPPIPGRSDYLHHLADLLGTAGNASGSQAHGPVTVLDIGMGANCIYPLIGASEYGWRFVGSEIDPVALRWARRLVAANPAVAHLIECRLQPSPLECFNGVIKTGETFDLSMCNPPFHASAEAAADGNRRKRRNLGGKGRGASGLNFGGTAGELWCDGGELAFVRRMIAQSAERPRLCRWFTTLVSKSTHLPRLHQSLREVGATEVRTIEMAQGQKTQPHPGLDVHSRLNEGDGRGGGRIRRPCRAAAVAESRNRGSSKWCQRLGGSGVVHLAARGGSDRVGARSGRHRRPDSQRIHPGRAAALREPRGGRPRDGARRGPGARTRDPGIDGTRAGTERTRRRGAPVTAVATHYASHLAPIYLWMAGGIEQALTAGAGDIEGLACPGGLAVDLGAGFGMHAIPLARAGCRVVAIDSATLLLEQLRNLGAGLPIETVLADLLTFRQHLTRPAGLIVCMGDTLPHLDDHDQVALLFREVSAALAPDGTFVATFRDYTAPPSGDSRFIPVRADSDRILTCFLETHPEHMLVHDILHERQGTAWHMRVSSYRKLRLSPPMLTAALGAARLNGTISQGPRGMLRLVARHEVRS